MKRMLCLLLCVLMLCGCSAKQQNVDRALEIRTQLQHSGGCSFEAQITADYGEEIHRFTMACQTDSAGKMQFRVLQPDSIRDITGYISSQNAALTFDDTVLAFSALADGQIAPVVSPWLVLRSLKSGYISATSQVDGGYILYIDDVYFQKSVHVQIYIDSRNAPVTSEIFWQGRRILSVQINNFAYV